MYIFGVNNDKMDNLESHIQNNFGKDYLKGDASLADIMIESVAEVYGVDVHLLRKPMKKLTQEEYDTVQNAALSAFMMGTLN